MKFIQNERLSDSMISFVLDWCLKSVIKAPDIAQTEILAILQYIIVHYGNTCRQVSIISHLKFYSALSFHSFIYAYLFILLFFS